MPGGNPHPTTPTIPGPARSLRLLLRLFLVSGLLVSIAYVLGESVCASSDRSRFIELYGPGLRDYQESSVEVDRDQQDLEVTLEGGDGLRVFGRLRAPQQSATRLPALLLLGGFRTGRQSIDFIPPTRDLILLAIDYPYTGKKSGLSAVEFVSALPAMRRAIVDTVPAAMLAVDYLLERPDVDGQRIVMVAGSVGALFAPSVVATDQRIAGAALLFGGGDIQSLLAANIREDLGLLTAPAAWLGKVLTCPVEPLHHIGAISPRPIFMLNGTEDLGIPAQNSRLLFEAAQEPKSQRWIDAGHVVLQDRRFHELVNRELVDWLTEKGFVSSAASIEPRTEAEPRPGQ